MFGSTWIFFIYDQDDGEVDVQCPNNYEKFKHDDQLLGEAGRFGYAVEIEAFQMM